MRLLLDKSASVLGPDGEPWISQNGTADRSPQGMLAVDARAVAKSFEHFVGSFQDSIFGLDDPASFRTGHPFKNHAWVYAAAMAIAVNLVQARFGVVRETEDETIRRQARCKRAGVGYRPRAGGLRTAIERHLSRMPRRRGMVMRGVEPFPEHPFTPVLTKPNSLMTQVDLVMAIAIWMSIRGEVGLLMLSESGKPLEFGEVPAEIWPINPKAYTPVVVQNRLVGWSMRVPKGVGLGSDMKRITLGLNELVQIRYYNPFDPFRGLSPLTAAVGNIEMDQLASQHNRTAIKRGANPGGVLMDRSKQGLFATRKDREEFEQRVEQRVAGPENNRRLLVLDGSLEFVKIGMTPQEMEHHDTMKWDREAILATLRVPKSVVSVTDDLNYSIQISQDFNFWDKCLLPLARIVEDALDGTLFAPETDDVMGAFDLSAIQALRVGVADQVKIATELTSEKLHVPPRTAFEVVGLEVPEYVGDDVALVSGMVTTLEQALEPPAPPPPPSDTGDPGAEEPEDGEDPVDGDPGGPPPPPRPNAIATPRRIRALGTEIGKSRNRRLWSSFIRSVHTPIETATQVRWGQWVREERRAQLALFDQRTRDAGATLHDRVTRVDSSFSVEAVLVDIALLQQRLGGRFRPLYAAALEEVFRFTVDTDLGGVPVFEFTDPRLMAFFDERQRRLVGQVPATLQRQLRTSLAEGVRASETIKQLRARVTEVFGVSASPAKTLQVARTETGGFANGARDVMFAAQGFVEEAWVNALDEHVREDHVTFGAAGPQARGFNYLTLVRDQGVLEYPHDPRAPAKQVINCRCMKRPVR